jgi:hypothetical protein
MAIGRKQVDYARIRLCPVCVGLIRARMRLELMRRDRHKGEWRWKGSVRAAARR